MTWIVVVVIGRCKHEMGLDCEDLLALADAAWRGGAGLADTAKLFDWHGGGNGPSPPGQPEAQLSISLLAGRSPAAGLLSGSQPAGDSEMLRVTSQAVTSLGVGDY